MTHCDSCGLEVQQAEYIELNGDEKICFACIQKNHGDARKALRKKQPKIISCPYCSKQYPYHHERCDRCGALNPVHDFHFWELFTNIALSTTIIIGLVTTIIAIATKEIYLFFSGIITIPLAIIILLFELLLIGVLYYSGMGLRELFVRKKGKRNKKSKKEKTD